MDIEEWRHIPNFPDYLISSKGRVYNERLGTMMRTSFTQHGHVKISLRNGASRDTRSVAQMVAEAFVEPPNDSCDAIIVLDGDFSHIAAENLAWRSTSFAWCYTHQLKTRQPVYYHNLPVTNLSTGVQYSSIIEAGMAEGLLFDDIWRSTHRKESIYPNGSVFQVDQDRV